MPTVTALDYSTLAQMFGHDNAMLLIAIKLSYSREAQALAADFLDFGIDEASAV